MPKKVIARDRQEVTSTDFLNFGSFAQGHGDIIAADGIGDGYYYSGLETTQDAEEAFTIVIAPGHVWAQGAIYERPTAVDIGGQTERYDLLQYAPATFERVVAAIGFGLPIETNFQPRETIIDILSDGSETRESRSVPMTDLRLANVSFIAGDESVAPQTPPITTGAVHFCNIYLTPAGISRIEMIEENLVPSAARNAELIKELLAIIAAQQSVIDGLLSELKRLYELLRNPASGRMLIELAVTAARLKERVDLPDTYSSFSADYFINEDESDLTQTGYDARIEFGMLFPIDASTLAAIALDNPNDPAVKVSPLGLVLPNYEDVVKFRAQSRNGDLPVSATESATYETKTRKISTWVHANGWDYNTYVQWWETTWNRDRHGRVYPLGQFATSETSEDTYVSEWTIEWQKAWTLQDRNITYVEPTVTQVTGVLVAQTFVCPSIMWATKIGLYFTSIDSTGDLTVLLTRTTNGRPLLEEVMARSVVNQSGLQSSGVTIFDFEPTLLQVGETYAVAIITSGNHRVAAATQGESGTEGVFFTGTSTQGFLEANLEKDVYFELYGARFQSPNTNVTLTAPTLAGGIDSIVAQNELAQPKGTKFTYEVQLNGLWKDILQAGSDLDVAQPSTLPIRARMSGTYDIAPAFYLKPDALRVSRSKTSFEHHSILRTLPSATDSFIAVVYVQRYDPAVHILNAEIVDEDAGPVTYTTPTDTEVQDLGEEGTRIRYTFTTPATTSNYRLKLTGQRGNPNPDAAETPFVVLEAIVAAV